MNESKPHDSFAAFREPNYKLFLSGWLPSSIGLQMQATALAWEVYERTGDPLSLGIIGLARALPNIAFALPAGQIVDLMNRKAVLISTQIGFALTSLFLAVGSSAWESGVFGSGKLGLWITYFLVTLTGLARVFNGPSRSSLLPTLFREGPASSTFHNAIAWNTGSFHLSAVLGPVIAGILIAVTGSAWPVYLVTTLSCLWFSRAAASIKPYGEQLDAKGANPSLLTVLRSTNIFRGMFEGVHYVWRERVVFGAIVLDLFAVLLGGATALMPIFAKDILHVGPVGLGMLKAAPYLGAVLMALLLVRRPPFTKSGPLLLWSVIGFALATIAFGFSTNLYFSLVMLALLGALDNISVVIRHVLVSVKTPDQLRGRVSAVNSVFIECSNEVGGFESGLVAKLFGPVFSVVSGGVGTLLVVAVVAYSLPELRRLGRLDLSESETAIDEISEKTI